MVFKINHVTMKIEKKILPKSIVELVVEEKKEIIAKFRIEALNYLRKNAEIKWFRKGSNIPDNIIIKHYSEEYINQITIEKAIDFMYREAIKKEKILPTAEAEIKEIISEIPLKIKIHIEIFPKVEISKKYKDIKLKKKKVKVEDKEVENTLKEIQTKFIKYEEVTNKKITIKLSDKITIDTDGYDMKWKLLKTTSMKDYPIILWSWVLVPGFEDWLIWSKLWDEKELDITFPKDYHNTSFAWKKTKFKIKIKKFEKSIKPEFTKEFIKQLRWKDLDLKWFKSLIKEEIKETKEANIRLEEEHKLIEELLKITKIEIWDKLLKNKIENVYNEIKENIQKDGMKVSDYLESLKLSEEDYKDKHVKNTALKRLQWELIFHKLMEIEKVEVKDNELNIEIEKILWKFESKDVLKRLKELYVPWTKYFEELKQRMAYRKLIDTFFE